MAEPKIRFKRDDGSSYPGWQEVALRDIATRLTRKNNKGETDRPLTIASIEGLVDQRTYFGKTIASKDMSGYFLLKKGEFAYNKSYSVGYDYGSIKRLDNYNMGALSTLYICFALNEDQNSEFYNCYFNSLSWYNQMAEICAEGARNHGLLNVSANDFFNIRLTVPSSLEEQQKIADFLSSVDEVIAASEQEVANLETQKKAVMKKIFSQEVRFKKEDGTNYPEWEVKLLGEVAEIKDSARVPNNLWKKSGVPYYRAKDFNDGNLQGELFISYEDYVNFKKNTGAPELGDLMFVSGGNVGLCVLKKDDKPVYVQGGAILYVRTSVSEHIEGSYLLHYFSSEQAKKYINNTAVGGTIIHFTLKPANSMPVLIPCLEEQNLIANFLSSFDEAISESKKELALWKELKKGLLQQMFV